MESSTESTRPKTYQVGHRRGGPSTKQRDSATSRKTYRENTADNGHERSQQIRHRRLERFDLHANRGQLKVEEHAYIRKIKYFA